MNVVKHFLKYILIFSVVIFSQVPDLCAGKKGINLGLWVPCEGENQTLSSSAKIREMLDFALKIGTKDVFLQVYRRDHAWFKTSYGDPAPYNTVWAAEKIDPLAFAIKEAHKRGLRIHGWFNICWIGTDLHVPIIKKLGRDVITKDQKGRSMADYPDNRIPGAEGKWYSYGEDGYWLDPGDDRVRKYWIDMFKEVLTKYPELDGLHMDFIRFPFTSPFLPGSYYAFNRGIEFGYGVRSIEQFKKKFGLNPMKMERTVKNHNAWDQWRRDQITQLIDQLRMLLREKSINMKLSCAVLPWPERAYFSSFQDWTRWVREGKVDFVVLMNYSVDASLAHSLSRMALGVAEKSPVWIGLGPYLFEKDIKGFQSELSDTLEMSPQGVVFFSYESLLKQPDMTRQIQEVLKERKAS